MRGRQAVGGWEAASLMCNFRVTPTRSFRAAPSHVETPPVLAVRRALSCGAQAIKLSERYLHYLQHRSSRSPFRAFRRRLAQLPPNP